MCEASSPGSIAHYSITSATSYKKKNPPTRRSLLRHLPLFRLHRNSPRLSVRAPASRAPNNICDLEVVSVPLHSRVLPRAIPKQRTRTSFATQSLLPVARFRTPRSLRHHFWGDYLQLPQPLLRRAGRHRRASCVHLRVGHAECVSSDDGNPSRPRLHARSQEEHDDIWEGIEEEAAT